MFTHGINPKVGSIDLSVDQKERLITSIKNCKLPAYEADYPEIKRVLLPRLENSQDKDSSFDLTVLEQEFMLYIASMSDDQDLYKHISFNSKF